MPTKHLENYVGLFRVVLEEEWEAEVESVTKRGQISVATLISSQRCPGLRWGWAGS